MRPQGKSLIAPGQRDEASERLPGAAQSSDTVDSATAAPSGQHFQRCAPTLIARGYFVVPIPAGGKRCLLTDWPNTRLTAAAADKYPRHGVGVICGKGEYPIVGVDIDISHPGICATVVNWCREHLGSGCERIGAAPRMLLVYRAAGRWAKGSSIAFFDPTDALKPNGKRNDQKVEILGDGQQFVAYHKHPDTGTDYEWTDVMGGLEHVCAADLPIITDAQVSALLAEVARLVQATPGLEVSGSASTAPSERGDGDNLSALSTRVGDLTFAQVAEMIGHLQNDDADYDTWLSVGAALHHQYRGTEHEGDALQMWRCYGAKSSKDEPSEYGYKWRSFGKSSGPPITLRRLIKLAQDAGWENPGHVSPSDNAPDEEVEPLDLLPDAVPGATFNAEHFPRVVSDLAIDISTRMGCDPLIPAFTALTAIAGMVPSRHQIQPKAHDHTWQESARLWVTLVGDPSTQKTPAIGAALVPIKGTTEGCSGATRRGDDSLA